jgi:hypothetical protein
LSSRNKSRDPIFRFTFIATIPAIVRTLIRETIVFVTPALLVRTLSRFTAAFSKRSILRPAVGRSCVRTWTVKCRFCHAVSPTALRPIRAVRLPSLSETPACWLFRPGLLEWTVGFVLPCPHRLKRLRNNHLYREGQPLVRGQLRNIANPFSKFSLGHAQTGIGQNH